MVAIMDHSLESFLNNARAAPYATTFILLAITLVATRLVSTLRGTSTSNGQAKTPPQVPYWIPFFGHVPSMVLQPNTFVRSLRDTYYPSGVFTLNFFGSRHNIIFSPALATVLLNQKASHADNEKVTKRIMKLIFGFPAGELEKYDAGYPELHGLYKLIQVEPGLGEIVGKTARKTVQNVQNLVTGVESPVDQTPWEKVSNVKVTQAIRNGEKVVEVSLMPLIRDFCAFTANPTFMGSDFLENFPDFFDGLWNLDSGFLLLATGLPRWFPIPLLTRAHIAKRNNLRKLEVWHEKLEQQANGEDPGPMWSSLDDVGSLIKARVELYRKYSWSIHARAAIEHSLMWAANANSNMLVFWMINRIYADRSLLAMIREEIAPYVVVEQEQTGLPIQEPPRIANFDVDGLCSNCPLLKSCYIECLRLDTISWSLKTVQQDFVLQSRDKEAQPWLLRKGDSTHVAHDLHNTDPRCFEDPMVWKADRHVKDDESKNRSADMGTLRPYGGGSSMCKGRAFAAKEMMIFSAAIIAMWELEPAGGGPWKMPKHKRATGVNTTGDDTRVWISRRKLS